jgi:hypothetical protein
MISWPSALLGFAFGALVGPIAIVVAIRLMVGWSGDDEHKGDRT